MISIPQVAGLHLWLPFILVCTQKKQTLEEAPHGRDKGPCVGDMKCESLAALGGSRLLSARLSLRGESVLLGLSSNVMTDS